MSDAARSWPRLERAIEQATTDTRRGRWRRLARWPARIATPINGPEPFAPGIYVFAFHSVIDPAHAEPWERAYAKVAITVDAFRRTLDFLARRFEPLALTEALALEGRIADRPYAVVTFDDGYTNTLTQAAPIAAACGFQPALFVNGAFAEGRVYYRVLVSLLTTQGHAHELREELRSRVPSVNWSSDAASLFDQTKDAYVRGAIEQASDAAFRRVFGDPADLRVHVTPEQVRALMDRGWEIANHTFAHDVLSDLPAEAVADTLERNERYWVSRGVPLLPCVAYPNGAAKHVGNEVMEYLDHRRDLHGMFCTGGVNYRAQRTEWLRMPVSTSFAAALPHAIADEVVRTREAAHVVERAAS